MIFSSFSRLCNDPLDSIRILRRVFIGGLSFRFLAAMRTLTGRVVAAQLRGKFLDVIYPSYFIVFDRWYELPTGGHNN